MDRTIASTSLLSRRNVLGATIALILSRRVLGAEALTVAPAWKPILGEDTGFPFTSPSCDSWTDRANGLRKKAALHRLGTPTDESREYAQRVMAKRGELQWRLQLANTAIRSADNKELLVQLKMATALILVALAMTFPPTTAVAALGWTGAAMLTGSGFSVAQVMQDKNVGEFFVGYTTDKMLLIGKILADEAKSNWKLLLARALNALQLLKDYIDATNANAEADKQKKVLAALSRELQTLSNDLSSIDPYNQYEWARRYADSADSTAAVLEKFAAGRCAISMKRPGRPGPPTVEGGQPQAR